MPKQDKNITPRNQTEIDILNLEKKYFQELENIFQNPLFAQNMHKMSVWFNSNYSYLVSKYKKANKVDIATQRLINFEVMKNLKNITNVYASPISSDIAYETTDVILLIDSKTNSELGNKNDFFDDFHYGPNQTSFNQDNFGKTHNFPGIPVNCDLPSIDPVTNKPILTFFLITSYFDDKNNQTFFWSKTNPNIRLICLPNGKISHFFKNDIVFNAKDYKYFTHKRKGKTVEKKLSKNHQFPQNAIKISTGNGSRSNEGYFLPKTKEIWIFIKGAKNPVYKMPVSLHERRTLIETIEDRYDSNGNIWKGHSEWKF